MAPRAFRRIVEWGDGWIPINVTPEEVAEGRAAIDRRADAAGWFCELDGKVDGIRK